MKTKAVQLLINSALPPELRDFNRPIDARGMGQLFHEVALRAPDQYARILKDIGDAGRNAAYWQGETMGLDDLRDVIDTPSYLKQMDQELAARLKGVKDPDEQRQIREDVWHTWTARIEKDAMKAAVAKQNAVGLSVASGARGKPLQLRSMLSTLGTFEDAKGRVVPLFARQSYAAGVSPGAWLAGTFGARAAVTSTKRATAKGGFIGKQLAQTAGNLMVTTPDCGTTNGIDLEPGDPRLRNRFLARGAAGMDANALIDRKALARVQNSKWDKPLIVRSPMTCEAKEGVCARCLGADPSGRLFPVGYAAGVTSANAIGEPLAQSALNVKHVSGASSKKASYSGLDWLIRFLQVPDNFPDRAPVASKSGRVLVRPAPQGGNYVMVGDAEHYVPQGLELLKKTGDDVEEGEPLSEGVVRPDDVVNHRGVGEGRRYYASRLHQMLADSGVKLDPRHTEVIARAAVNHVQVLDPDDDYTLPDDVVPFSSYWNNHHEDPDTKSTPVVDAAGKYLQNNALHYTPGTKLTGSMVQRLSRAGITEVPVTEKVPKFTPTMVRMQTQSFAQPDWLAAMGTSYLGRQLARRAMRGDDTNIKDNINFIPRLAVGEGFGQNVGTTGKF